MSEVKKYHCCVPGCHTYETADSFLRVPNISDARFKWVACIPRKDWVIDETTIICTRHFRQSDFRLVTIQDLSTSHVITKTMVPMPNLVPSSFAESTSNDQPSSQENCDYYPKEMFQLDWRDSKGPDTFSDLEVVDGRLADHVIDFWYLKMMHADRLDSWLARSDNPTGNWHVSETTDKVSFFTIDFSTVPRVPTCVHVDSELSVMVFLDGRQVDPADLNCVLPANCRLNRWSQLEQLMRIYGN